MNVWRTFFQGSSKNDECEDNSDSDNELPMRRRGKRLRKRKCRRGSTYGQQTEVRDPPEPPETQVSQVDDESRRNSSVEFYSPIFLYQTLLNITIRMQFHGFLK